MVHPAVLKAEFQRTYIAGRNQLAGLHAQIGSDLFHPLLAIAHLHAPGCAESQVVGAEGRSGEAQPQAGALAEAAEGMAPGGGLGFFGVHAQVVHLVCDGEPSAPAGGA